MTMNPEPGLKTNFLTVHGSRGYGLSTANSDWDYRGFFFVAPWNLLGFLEGEEQKQVKKDNVDTVAWEFRKFVRLASKCNPNVIEVLFTDPSDQKYDEFYGDLAQQVIDNRHLFLSKRAYQAFGGYAFSQLEKVKNKDWNDAGIRKDAMHCYRLVDFGIEILKNNNLTIKVKNPEYYMDVRNGNVTQDTFIENAKLKFKELDEANEASKIQERTNDLMINTLVVDIHKEYLDRYKKNIEAFIGE